MIPMRTRSRSALPALDRSRALVGDFIGLGREGETPSNPNCFTGGRVRVAATGWYDISCSMSEARPPAAELRVREDSQPLDSAGPGAPYLATRWRGRSAAWLAG